MNIGKMRTKENERERKGKERKGIFMCKKMYIDVVIIYTNPKDN